MRNSRKTLAFIIAPILPSLFFLVALHPSSVRLAAFMLVFSVPFSYLPCFLLGLPLMRFLEKRHSLNTLMLTISGALLGIIVFYIFGFVLSGVLSSSKGIVPGVGELGWGAALGALVAISFGLIAGFPLFKSGAAAQ